MFNNPTHCLVEYGDFMKKLIVYTKIKKFPKKNLISLLSGSTKSKIIPQSRHFKVMDDSKS